MAGLAGVFVIGVSCFMLWKRRNRDFAILSIRTASWFGLIGLILTIWTGDGSAVQVARHQPMKLAAMEGLYHGHEAQAISAVAILNPRQAGGTTTRDEYLFDISIPYGLSILAKHDPQRLRAEGIADIVKGVDIVNGDTVNTVSYAERIDGAARPPTRLSPHTIQPEKRATKPQWRHLSMTSRRLSLFRLRILQQRRRGNTSCGLTFTTFRLMVILGSYFFLFYIFTIALTYKPQLLERWRWFQLTAMIGNHLCGYAPRRMGM